MTSAAKTDGKPAGQPAVEASAIQGEFPEQAEFWAAAAEGRLLLKWCKACGKPHYFPRDHCPLCGSLDTEWREASGRGRIYSFTRSSRSAGRVIAPAIVDLEEGLRISTSISDADLYSLAIGDEVLASFPKAKGAPTGLAFTTPQAAAARAYSTRALAASASVRGVDAATPAPAISSAAVVGAGRMGFGIALALILAGIDVTLIDKSQEAVDKAAGWIDDELRQMTGKGRIPAGKAAECRQRLSTGTEVKLVAAADIVIEAVWEQMALKKDIFRQIDAFARPGAILGTNTSTLDINDIASVTSRPHSVVGLHFFSPAHVMKLLEVVRTRQTGEAALRAARELARRLGKVAVVVGVCHGFVGNRLMIAREAEAGRLLLEGSSPQQVDRILTEFGLPMGTFELQDMAGGIELSYRRRQETGEKNWLIDQLFERGRTGLKSGKGYYRYAPGKRAPLPDPEVEALIVQASKEAGVTRRTLADQEVLERLIYPMINEGAKLIAEHIVDRGSDIDVVWQYGFGWPSWKGGPMYHADQIGLDRICKRLDELAATHGDFFKPAQLLRERAAQGKLLAS